jgi:serine/threonine-protein kinase
MDGPVDGSSSDTLRPGTMLGRYEIRRLLGQGGMGCVYEAQHRDLKKRVAIKTLLPSLASNADAKERFLREGEAASRIRHPHVVDVTDLGSEGAVIYLVMEYLEGEDLARLLARQGFLSPQQAADVMLPVAAAIATAHEQGVIHRDLKPENIFLSRSAYGAVHPKVLDFGISKVLGDSRARALTGTAATMGTMHYLPPEQLRAAREADARSDQYGLGTILYECLTGQRAFEEDSFYLLLKKIAEGEFERPSLRRPGLPERMEAIVLRAMSLDPLGRFDSVKQLGAALLEFGSDATRMLWAPFFGAAPAIDLPASGSPLSNAPTLSEGARSSGSPASRPPSERPRVATLVAPSTTPSGATMELPQPTHNRKASSTTLRNATGERAMPTRPGTPWRWRAPAIVGGVALVAAISVLLILRGTGGGERHEDTESTSAATSSSTASRPVIAAPDEPKLARPIARPPEVKPPSTEPGTEPTPAQNPAAGAKTGSETAAAAGEPAGTRREDSTPAHKVSSKGTRKGGAAKSGRAGKTTPTASPQESSPPAKPDDTPKSPNGAPVISN